MLVGGGPEHAAVAAAVRRAGLDGVVALLGDRDDVPALLAAADVFVLASRSEGFPMSVLEAMAAGLPVVASAVGGVPEAVLDGETGLLVPPGDAGAVAGARARALLADGRLRARDGVGGARRGPRRTSGSSASPAPHVQVYERALAEAPKRRRR